MSRQTAVLSLKDRFSWQLKLHTATSLFFAAGQIEQVALQLCPSVLILWGYSDSENRCGKCYGPERNDGDEVVVKMMMLLLMVMVMVVVMVMMMVVVVVVVVMVMVVLSQGLMLLVGAEVQGRGWCLSC